MVHTKIEYSLIPIAAPYPFFRGLILTSVISVFQDYVGETPVHKAARAGSMDCLKALVSSGAQIEYVPFLFFCSTLHLLAKLHTQIL